MPVVGAIMGGMVVLACLVVFYDFNGVLCAENNAVNWDSINNLRTKRYAESDNQTLTHNITTTLSSKIIEPKENIIAEYTDSIKTPTNERYELNDVRNINNMLIDIATIAHNENNTKGIDKIRHLVDEITKQTKMKENVEVSDVKSSKKEPSDTNVKTVLRQIGPINDIETKEMVNIVSLKKPTKMLKNDQLVTENANVVLKHVEPINYIETKETVDIVPLKKPVKHTKIEQVVTENTKIAIPIHDIESNETVNIVSSKKDPKLAKNGQLVTRNANIVLKHVEPRNNTTTKETIYFVKNPLTGDHKDTKEIKSQAPLFTNTRRHDGDLSDHDGDRAKITSEDKNQIKIKEHLYEEELLRRPNTKENAYNWYKGQNYKHNYGSRNMFTGNKEYIDNYYSNGDDYPYYNDDYEYYTNSHPLSKQTNEVNKDCTRYTKTTFDRDTVISIKPHEQLVKSLNEDGKELTNIQSNNFYGEYYSGM
ncbi:uncharacterized protein LOC134675993 [Cydia fagiglandana]|uniref:uncharacterized protein LOC134675993 n=1 Tax=Cydia fagiglandana TaxID=1458189 RepID=UPI002FEE2A2E